LKTEIVDSKPLRSGKKRNGSKKRPETKSKRSSSRRAQRAQGKAEKKHAGIAISCRLVKTRDVDSAGKK